jgi:hypothetical protein
MNANIVVSPYFADARPKYDLFVATLGYEERARFLAESRGVRGRQSIAWAFDGPPILSFEDNQRAFEAAGFQIVPESEGSPDEFIDALDYPSDVERPVHLCVDISSASRIRLAKWFEAIIRRASEYRFVVDFVYAEALFTPPAAGGAPNTSVGPVLPMFAGWSSDPNLPTSLLIGLGYEPDRAIGAVEYIEPAEVIALEPASDQKEFAPALHEANAQLWAYSPRPRRLLYTVHEPFQTFMMLSSLLGRLRARSRPIILPFGPKIFALVGMSASLFHPSVSVWRVSAGAEEEPVQRRAIGRHVGLTIAFAPKQITQPLRRVSGTTTAVVA